jgi:uncharacterized protein YjbI with pentapeptide repeats
LLQALAGALLATGAYLTWRQLQVNREGQITDRYTKAVEQLGHDELDVRLGGIYALERIANDSADDRATIAEVLTAFVRGHAPWPPRLPGQYVAEVPIEQVPELQVRAPDVQAVLTVLARRLPAPKLSRLDLRATDLRKAILDGATFQEAHLAYANLHKANLVRANLQGADLRAANFQGATLDGADLRNATLQEWWGAADFRGASLVDANLQGARLHKRAGDLRVIFQDANLTSANLQDTHLARANLQRATLNSATLQSARLTGADLQSASLANAELQGVDLRDAKLHGATLDNANLQGAKLAGAQLKNARANPKTTWPTGFDPSGAGVMLIDRRVDAADGPES